MTLVAAVEYLLHGLANTTVTEEISKIIENIGEVNETAFQNERFGIHGINKSASMNSATSALERYAGTYSDFDNFYMFI